MSMLLASLLVASVWSGQAHVDRQWEFCDSCEKESDFRMVALLKAKKDPGDYSMYIGNIGTYVLYRVHYTVVVSDKFRDSRKIKILELERESEATEAQFRSMLDALNR
jgi:hypothetical protein